MPSHLPLLLMYQLAVMYIGLVFHVAHFDARARCTSLAARMLHQQKKILGISTSAVAQGSLADRDRPVADLVRPPEEISPFD